MTFYVYILGSKKRRRKKTYVGWTNNLIKRLQKHNSGKGAKSTRGYKWKFLYHKRYLSKQEAMSQEYFLKKNKLKRKKIATKFLSTSQL